MKHSLSARLAKLEAVRSVHPITLYFENGAPITINGTAKNFFRIVTALTERQPLSDLGLLRRAARIEGASAQLFALAQALAKGPAPDSPQLEPEPEGVSL